MLITIALRNIFRQPRRSALTILAISFSVFCIIIFQSLKVGLHQKMIDSSLSLDLASVQIHSSDYEPNVTQIQPLPAVNNLLKELTDSDIWPYSVRLKSPALILVGSRSSSILLTGIIPEQEENITLISRKMTDGEYVTNGTNSLLMSRELAKNLKLKIGDDVSLMLRDIHGQPVVQIMEVGGLYNTGLSSFDASHLYLPLATLQKLLQTENGITEIALLTKPELAIQTAALLQEKLDPAKYRITSWQEMAPDLVQLMALNDATFTLLVIIIFCIVAMGIANTMNSVIFERFREFGTMAAIGTTPAEIISLVSFESLFLGVFACLTGTTIALLTCLYLYVYGIDLSHFTSSNHYFAAGSILKAYVLPRDVIVANLITLLTAIGAGLYPAVKAATLNPVDALDYT